MTSQEQTEYLATKIMGWQKGANGSSWVSCNTPKKHKHEHFIEDTMVDYEDFCLGFNPLEDWNHWREVEERLMEDGKSLLIKAFMANFDGKFDYLGSSLEERVTYLIEAHSQFFLTTAK